MSAPSSSPVHLSRYSPGDYTPGRSLFWQALWFFAGLPLLRSTLLPGSGWRCLLLRSFGAQVGPGVVIKPGVRVKFPWRLRVGDYTWIGEDAWLDNLAPVELGSNVCISQAAYFCTGNHDWSDPRFPLRAQPITVQDGAWVGARVTLGPGVTLGVGAIAAVGSVVNRPIPAGEIHAGNPARFVRQRPIA